MSRRRPLSARRRLEPTWLTHPVYVDTYGPEVADIAALANFAPDPEQELILDLLFAVGADGKSVAFEAGVVGARQMFKTGLVKQAELGWLFVTDQRRVVHSAHEMDTTEETFNDLRNLIENTPALSRHLDLSVGKSDSRGFTLGNGRWGIYVRGSQGQQLRLRCKARTSTGGRGLTGNRVVLDEAFAVTPAMVGSLYPTLAAVPDPQVLIASSGGLPQSAHLRSLRNRGRAGDDRLVWVEYGDRHPYTCQEPDCTHAAPPDNPPGCALDDEDRWWSFMPALGGRVALDTIRAFRRSMPPAEFAREFMVWWDDPPTADEDGAIDFAKWVTLANPRAARPSSAKVVVDVSPDRRKATIAVGAAGTDGKTLVMTTTGAGHDWVVGKLERLRAEREVLDVALHPKTQASLLIPDLKTAGIEWEPLTNEDAGASCAWLISQVAAGGVEHVGQAELDAAVMNAKTRRPGEGEVEMWDRRDPRIDISPVVAAAHAGHRWSLTADYDVMDSIG